MFYISTHGKLQLINRSPEFGIKLPRDWDQNQIEQCCTEWVTQR